MISQGLRKGEGKDFIFFTLMKRLGHSSINTTINVYSHLFPSQQKEVANAFDDFKKKWAVKFKKQGLNPWYERNLENIMMNMQDSKLDSLSLVIV